MKLAEVIIIKLNRLKKNLLFLIFSLFVNVHSFCQERIPMTLEESGIYTVPCEVNGLKLRFVFDTGASEVHLSLIEAAFMLKNGYIDQNDFIGTGEYSLADGSIAENSIVNLKEIKIGNVIIKNVTACISSNLEASLLLGQSAIRKLGPYSINGDFLILDNHSINDLNGLKKITDASGNEYYGFVSNGVYEGQGKMTYTNGKTYEGEWRLGKRNGYGVLRYKNGNIEYEGEWKEDKRHGHGISYGIIGNYYVGNFANDTKYGKGISYTSSGDSTVAVWTANYDCIGTKYYKNGETMTGSWIGGYKEGKFVHTYPNGRKVQEYYQKDSLTSTKILNSPNGKDGNDEIEKYEHFTGKGEKKYKDGTYNGDFVNGKRQGYGTMTYNNGDSYKGNWYYDHFDGKGTYVWVNGDKYVGDFKNGWRQGSGVYTWPNGDKYVGQFEKSKRSGKGKMTYKSGGSYDGEWSESKWNGLGTVVYDNGDKYIGSFLAGKRHGEGIMYYVTGNMYDGKWVNNLYEGNGTYSWKNGDKYVGSFKEGLKSGYGTYTWVEGDRYEGYWSDNKQNGYGTFYYSKGGSKKGNWKDGKFQDFTSTSNYSNTTSSYSNNTSSSNRDNDESYTYKYVPKSYFTAYATVSLNLYKGPGKSYDIITTIPEGGFVFMETNERYNKFAKVMDIKTGEEGYVNSNYLDGYTKVKINEEGSLEVIGKTYSKYAEINLINDANVTAKITIGNNTYTLAPNSSKRIKNIEGGTYNIMASSPGVIPYVGVDSVEGGYEYSWRFYIQKH